MQMLKAFWGNLMLVLVVMGIIIGAGVYTLLILVVPVYLGYLGYPLSAVIVFLVSFATIITVLEYFDAKKDLKV